MLILDGKKLSEKRLQILKDRVLKSQSKPGLAVIRIGEDAASKVYVAKKIKTCQEMGFYSIERHLPATVTQADVLKEIQKLNKDPKIHGILVQLPLPKHLSDTEIIECIDPKKDVDGFHPLNRGRFLAGQKTFCPCTPLGIMHLLSEYGIDPKGKSALVIGRSLIVGRPMSLLLDRAGATVTVAHSHTRNLDQLCASADIIVVAIGKPHFLSQQKLKPGVVIVDVGINRLESGKLVGDVDYEKYSCIASAMTPVPGGVGPMTICTLLENTWQSFEQEHSSTS